MRTLLITGLSGAGKSSAVKTLEDMGFYCIDNLPVPLVRSILELSGNSSDEIQKLAIVVDARDKKFISRLPNTLAHLRAEGRDIEVVFLNASDDVLSRRFSETRHRHPLSPSGTPLEGIQKERELLEPLRQIANQVIDTSEFSTSDLRRLLISQFDAARERPALGVRVTSFGFKHGLPTNSDLVLDVRFLPNPFFKEELSALPGTDLGVQKFVMEQADTKQLLTEYQRLLEFLLPRFDREGKSYLHIAIGCTGGRHRSVVIASELAREIERQGWQVQLVHRDLGRE